MPLDETTLRKDDILLAVRYLVELKNGNDPDKRIDDIDHLGNRRVRVVGELLENQYRIGLVRMERAIKERMSLQEIEQLMPHDLINSKPVSAVVKEFFGSSQLSQFMDQTNPLGGHAQAAALGARAGRSHARARRLRGARRAQHPLRPRLPGRDAGRPEHRADRVALDLCAGQRLRLHRDAVPHVENGTVTDDVVPVALEEERVAIAQANAPLTDKKQVRARLVSARKTGRVRDDADRPIIDMMDVSPNQLVSVAASLIPFLENDDANRALMGSNMQRQALPLLRTEAPLVGTGHGGVVAATRRDRRRQARRHRRERRRLAHRHQADAEAERRRTSPRPTSST